MRAGRILQVSVLGTALLAAGCAAAPSTPAPPAPTSAAGAGGTTVVAVAPPAAPHCTIWQFLGVDKLLGAIGGGFNRLINCLGMRFPGLEPKPPLKSITDPANLQSPNPAVKSAAAVKAEEDAAPQKIKALNYLATVGCGCYPEVKPALLAALDDCTESVRFAAVSALRDAAGIRCQACRTNSCCDPEVITRLQQVASELNDQGCFKEPSARVRRVARQALRACQGIATAGAEELPLEGGVPDAPLPPAQPEAAPPVAANSSKRGGDLASKPMPVPGIVRPVDDGPRHEFVTTPIAIPANHNADAASRTATSQPRAADVVAEIADQVITRNELTAAVKDRQALRLQPPGDVQAVGYQQSVEQQELERLIDRKLVWLDARSRMTPTDLVKHTTELQAKFDAQVAATIQQKGLGSRENLDRFLQQYGTSLERQRSAWCEEMLAAEWLHALEVNLATLPVSAAEELAWYAAHHHEFHRAGRQLSLEEARDEIQGCLREARHSQHRQQYLAGLRGKARIWTAFDQPVVAAGGQPEQSLQFRAEK